MKLATVIILAIFWCMLSDMNRERGEGFKPVQSTCGGFINYRDTYPYTIYAGNHPVNYVQPHPVYRRIPKGYIWRAFNE